MTDPRTERVARAIAEVWGHRGNRAWLRLPATKRMLFIDAAKAALAAAEPAEIVHLEIRGPRIMTARAADSYAEIAEAREKIRAEHQSAEMQRARNAGCTCPWELDGPGLVRQPRPDCPLHTGTDGAPAAFARPASPLLELYSRCNCTFGERGRLVAVSNRCPVHMGGTQPLGAS